MPTEAPRGPDRYDKRVRELAIHVEELIFDGDTECGSRLRWSLRRIAEEAEASALERAAREADKGGAIAMRIREMARALCAPSPEAPPAKEPCRAEVASRFPEYSHYECELPGGHVGPHSEGGTEWTDATTVVAPPSEPVAPAPSEDSHPLSLRAEFEKYKNAEKRIAELEGLLEEAREMVDVLGEGHAADLVARIDAALSRTASPGKEEG